MEGRPRIAVVDPNTLAALGLKQLLQTVMPIMTVDTFGSFTELSANQPEKYFHYFVAMNIVLENKSEGFHRLLTDALLQFSAYAGVGVKTTLGMGGVEHR